MADSSSLLALDLEELADDIKSAGVANDSQASFEDNLTEFCECTGRTYLSRPLDLHSPRREREPPLELLVSRESSLAQSEEHVVGTHVNERNCFHHDLPRVAEADGSDIVFNLRSDAKEGHNYSMV
ncbi:hypothetical protein E4U30_004270 [Claviceps sp. LM220 group G6]|nr:hypothetical protein E4U30_004270 [Claviceps sp. LM220 group G6]